MNTLMKVEFQLTKSGEKIAIAVLIKEISFVSTKEIVLNQLVNLNSLVQIIKFFRIYRNFFAR
jgi:hypothetical protein